MPDAEVETITRASAGAASPGFGVYVHWPFCLSKCPYCDFNSHVRHAPIDEVRFLRAFESEIAHAAARAPGRTVSSIFFGGGTPSLMAPETTGAILDAIARHWSSRRAAFTSKTPASGAGNWLLLVAVPKVALGR